VPKMSAPRLAIGPQPSDFAVDAVVAGGGEVVGIDEGPCGLIWLHGGDPAGLSSYLTRAPEVEWVQLPMAGIEAFAEVGLLDPKLRWTCAKGAYAEPVAEHALALALAGLRQLPTRLAARTWGSPSGTSLFGQPVTILGGGGITTVLLELLKPFQVEATVVRRRPVPMDGASRTVGVDELAAALPGAQVVFLALALTPATVGIIGEHELASMDETSWLVNVARGKHVVTDELVDALRSGVIAGAALDVTDPEPLPDGHPLWDLLSCIITPHTADTIEMVLPMLAERICLNVGRFATGEPLLGPVDPLAGY
jgi:phosphoglycerate dehydrogenase-like enzyme